MQRFDEIPIKHPLGIGYSVLDIGHSLAYVKEIPVVCSVCEQTECC